MASAVHLYKAITTSVAISLWAMGCGAQQGSAHTTGESGKADDERGSTTGGTTEPQLPDCSDGTCFRCGDGICPSGFYCESNGSATGCAWFPKCVQTPSCSCLEPLVSQDSACSCEDRDGVAFVTCS